MNSVVSRLSKFAILAAACVSWPAVSLAQHYQQTNLVSNVPVTPAAAVPDPNLQNSWGLVHGPATPWWISNNAGGTSTLYDTAGLNPLNPPNQTPAPTLEPVVIVPLNAPGGQPGNGVIIQAAPGQQPPVGSPTSVLFNGDALNPNPTEFLLAPGKPAIFMWVTEDGTVQGWNPGLNPTTAIIKVDHSQVPNAADGAVYKGAALVTVGGNTFLLAANFRSGRIDVFDSTFTQVQKREGFFDDDARPRDLAPFNVVAVGDNVYVTYAKQDAAKHDPVGGAGLGFVSVFSRDGHLRAHLEHGSWFNAPWGVVLTPAQFGTFSHTILVGQFRGGTIAAFDVLTGKFLGNVLNGDGSTLNIDGLWALVFGNGNAAGPATTLFFTAGPDNETNGLFGTLTPVAAELNTNPQ